MIKESIVRELVEEWLEGKDYFLVDVAVSADDRITVEIDHAEGVWIEDCADLSRFIESRLSRDEEDYELEVGSAGIGQPFKVRQQYVNHVGREVDVLTADGRKLHGVLAAVGDETFDVTVKTKKKLEGEKRPKWVEETVTLRYDETKETKYSISFK